MTDEPDRYALAQRIYDDYHARIIRGGGEAEHAFRFALQELIELWRGVIDKARRQ